MAAVTVTANNTRVHDSQSNTGWSNEGGGGPSPASEPQLKYVGSNVVNRKVTSTSSRTGVQYNAGTALDMTAAANALWLFKGYVTDFGDLNATWGVEAGIGSAAGARYEYNLAGSGANRGVFSTYPDEGGYLIVAIDPNIAAWREATVGAPDLTAVDHYEIACQFVTGGAKSENVALSAIDVGTGLTLTGGDGASDDGTFQDFVDADQGTVANRYGYAISKDGALTFRGMMTIGGADATEFTDNDAKVSFPDGYHSAGLFGVTVDIQNAGSDVSIGASLSGLGSSTTEDTRPDYIVTGTSGSHTLTGVLDNFRNIALTSAVTVDGATIGFSDLAQGGATITGARLLVDSASGAAACDDADFTKLTDSQIIQAGAGHAIEITTPGTYNLSDLTWSGFGATGSNSAAIYNNSGGAVTINVSGGTSPTYRNGTGATTTVSQPVAFGFSGIPAGLEGRVRRGSISLYHVQNITGGTFTYNFTSGSGKPVTVTFGGVGDDGIAYERQELKLTLPATDLTIPLSFTPNPSYQH